MDRHHLGPRSGGCSSAGRVPDCDSGCRGFESHQPPHSLSPIRAGPRCGCSPSGGSVAAKAASAEVPIPIRTPLNAMRFTVATYNIHKGFTHFTRRMVIHEVKERLHGLSADILFLQEVLGIHERHAFRYTEWPGKPQHEFIADAMWREVAYGKNAVYRHGHHGNA